MTTATKERYTASQEAFCLFLFQGHSQIESYKRAFPNQNYSTANALYVKSSQLASLPKIRLRLAELNATCQKPTIASVEERKERLTHHLRAELVDFVGKDGDPLLSKETPHHQAAGEYSVTTKFNKKGEPYVIKTIKLRDPIAAIAELNKMERIGQVDTIINNNNDNRSVTIIVKSEEGKQALEALRTGKLPQLKGGA